MAKNKSLIAAGLKGLTIDGEIKEILRYATSRDLALGYLRYEAVRKLTTSQFQKLCGTSLYEGTPFDTLIDALVLEDINS